MKKEEVIKKVFPKGNVKVLSPIYGGMMNESYVLIDNDTKEKYVLFMPTDQANEMVDRKLEYDNQNIAINLGITCENIYFDVDKGIKINRYLDGLSLNHVKNEEIDLKKVSLLLKTLHNSPLLSKKDYLPFERLKGFINERKALYQDVPEEYQKLENLIFQKQSYLEKDKLVLSHNDFQKSNIMKVNDNYYMIDFEFMMNNYEMYDVACYGNEEVSIGLYLCYVYYEDKIKEDPSLVNLYLYWRIFLSLQWYNVALIKHIRGEGEVHHIAFDEVAKHFLHNALEAYKLIK